MAEYPYTVSFRLGPTLREWLRELSEDNHRQVGEVVRMLLEEVMERESERE